MFAIGIEHDRGRIGCDVLACDQLDPEAAAQNLRDLNGQLKSAHRAVNEEKQALYVRVCGLTDRWYSRVV